MLLVVGYTMAIMYKIKILSPNNLENVDGNGKILF